MKTLVLSLILIGSGSAFAMSEEEPPSLTPKCEITDSEINIVTYIPESKMWIELNCVHDNEWCVEKLYKKGNYQNPTKSRMGMSVYKHSKEKALLHTKANIRLGKNHLKGGYNRGYGILDIVVDREAGTFLRTAVIENSSLQEMERKVYKGECKAESAYTNKSVN